MPWIKTVVFNRGSYYNVEDINRVNNNVEFIRQFLLQQGYTPALVSPVKSDYQKSDFPTVTAINNVRRNLKYLLSLVPEALRVVESTGFIAGTFYAGEEGIIFGSSTVPTITINTARLQTFDFNRANELELTLQLLYDTLMAQVDNFKKSGTFYSGEEGLI
ncbi:hypothetical protein J2T13_004959 [Paenibacillus sp. DS2015]|uniref:hypothetical protein n=1 Tax=Paenibacillus sp. DS2015 TaxID=3373917 RepID=UPI003D1E889D